MIFGSILTEKIIHFFIEHPNSKISDLKNKLNQEKEYITMGGLYKKIANLILDQILQKQKTRYIIHPLFIAKIHTIQKKLTRTEELLVGQSSDFFPKHIAMNSFIQTSFIRPYRCGIIASLSQEKKRYEYSRQHAYLLSLKGEQNDHPNMVTKLTQSHLVENYICIVGIDSLLSEYGLEIAKKQQFTQCKILGKFLFDSQVRVVTIIGDYLISLYVSDEFNQIVDSYIINTSVEQYSPEYLQSLWHKESPCSIIIEHDPLKATQRKNKIIRSSL